MPAELVTALRSRTSRRDLSSYITEAIRHQPAMDGLAKIVAAHEEAHGVLTEQEIEAVRRKLFGDKDAEQGSV